MSKFWKRLLLIILIIACLINITVKLVKKVSFDDAINAAKAKYESIKTSITTKK